MTKHSHYSKDVSHLSAIDVYRVLSLFGVTDQAIGHAIKKLLCPGQRGAKTKRQDIQEAIDTLERWKAMEDEDGNGHVPIAKPVPGIQQPAFTGSRCLVCGHPAGHGGLPCPRYQPMANNGPTSD